MCACDSQYLGRVGQSLIHESVTNIVPSTSALLLGYPIHTASLKFDCMFHDVAGLSWLQNAELVERVTSGNDKKYALRLHLFKEDPGAPTMAAVYTPDESKLITTVNIAAGLAADTTQNVGYRQTSPTSHRATAVIDRIVKAHTSYTSVWAIICMGQSGTYITGTNLDLYLMGTRHS